MNKNTHKKSGSTPGKVKTALKKTSEKIFSHLEYHILSQNERGGM